MASPDMALGGSEDDLPDECKICSSKFVQPRVLSCLHVFCEECLKKLLQENGFIQSSIVCPVCKQETKLTSKGVEGLPLDLITCNRIDLTTVEKSKIVCNSCKTKETAVARCTECASFLCPNCVSAHQFMRCFEHHKVLSFDEMKESGETLVSINKPVLCDSHPEEAMKFFCHTCHIPICNECMIADHKPPEHYYQKSVDAEKKQREDLKNLMSESKSKVEFCDEASSVLENHLSELQMQRDSAKSHIEETFQTFKAFLEKSRDQKLEELDSLHSAQELQIMETCHNVEKTVEKIEDACKFADRLLTQGKPMEVLSLINVVGTQLLSLINNAPKLDTAVGISFETDEAKFEECIKENFGQVKKPEPPAKKDPPTSQKTSPMHSSFESDVFSLSTGGMTPENSLPPLEVDLTSNPLPQLDVDLTNNLFAQFNLAQLAGMADASLSHTSPAGDSATGGVNFSDFLIPTTVPDVSTAEITLANLAALANMGNISLDDVEQPVMNGAMMSGLIQPTSLSNSPPLPLTHLRAINPPSPDFMGNNSIAMGNSRIASPIMNGGPMMKGGLKNPHMPSALSPVDSQATIPPPRSASRNAKMNTMQIRCKFGQLGAARSQFSSPHGFCLGLDEEIIVADTNNHRIQVFEKTGDFKYQFGVTGKEEGQLWYPRKVAVIPLTGKFVVCDRGAERSRMQIFSKNGHFLKRIAIRYVDIVAGLVIKRDGTIAAVDSVAPTLFVISEAGDLLHWFDCSDHMKEPSDLAVWDNEYYICDFKGHSVIVFDNAGQFIRRIGGFDITNFPNGIDISGAGDILVGDSHGNRFHICVFTRDGTMVSEFECPYVKVSRCCGLKITSEGYVVTLAKNNHHVLVLNTLYIS